MIFPIVSFISGSPSKSIEVKIYSVMISIWIMSVVAKVNGSICIVMGVPMGVLQELFGDISFSPSFQDDISFV